MALVTLVIDMQTDFFAHERLARGRAELAAHVNDLVQATRDAGQAVVWVKQEFSPDLGDATLEVRRRRISVVIAGTPGAAILPELDVAAGDRIVVKRRYSAFFGTDLDEILQRLGCTRIIVAGINSHACVRATVVDAYQRDYDLILARDCIDSHDAEHHEITWRYLDGKLGRGLSNAQIRDLLRAGRA